MKHTGLKKGWTRRFKMMMRHTWLVGIAFVLLSASVAGIAYYFASLPIYLKIAVGPPNSEDVRVVQAIAQQLRRDHAKVRLRPVIMDGGVRDARTAIDNNKTDLAIVRRDVGLPKAGQAVAIWRKNVAVFIIPTPEPDKAKPKPAAKKAKADKPAKAAKKAKADKTDKTATDDEKIEKIQQLIGKRLGVVGRSETNLDLLKAVLRQYFIPPEKIVILNPDVDIKARLPDVISVVLLPTNNVGAAIRDAKLDAILAVGPVSSSVTADAIAAATRDKEPPTFLGIDVAEAIAERSPIHESTEIKAGAFGGAPAQPEESIDTISVNHYLVARKSLSDDTVAEFTKLLFSIRQSLAAEVPSTTKIEKPDTDKDATVPVHPGAIAYLDGEIKTFFDRYSDLMYWGLMIFSLFGSAIAGLASYSKSDDRSQRLEALHTLLDLTKSARCAETTEELDRLQAEVDLVLAAMVQEVEGDGLDETAIHAYSVMLDQAQAAIADRRAALQGQPARARISVARTELR